MAIPSLSLSFALPLLPFSLKFHCLCDGFEIACVTKYGNWIFFFELSPSGACPERSFCTTSVVLIR